MTVARSKYLRLLLVLAASYSAQPTATPGSDHAAIIRLPPMSEAAARLQADPRGPPLIGIGRPLDLQQGALDARWRRLPDGRHALTVRLVSPGALGVRVAIEGLPLPAATVLRVAASSTESAQVFSGDAFNASLRAGGPGEPYWSPLVEGEILTLEVEIPATVDPTTFRLTLPRLSHLFQLPYSPPGPPRSDGCFEDVMCHPAWDTPSRSTAILLHTSVDGDSGVCTGTLLNDADPATQIPYVLTAYHCVPDQTQASSLETYWLHRSIACGGSIAAALTVTGGADLLYSARPTDTSFLRLRRAPPAGVVFAGWQATPPDVGAVVAGVHHPLGQPQRLAVGVLTESLNCLEVEDCGAAPEAGEEHYWRVNWSQGATAGGSSGSGLFLASGELIGNLFGGFSRCDSPDGPDDYGRFDLAYRAALYRWLGPR